MKGVLLVLVLLVVGLQCVSGQIAASFNQTLAVNTTAQTYTFFTIPFIGGSAVNLVVSSPSAGAASSVIVNSFGTLPLSRIGAFGSIVVNGGLPAGYVSFSSAAISGYFGAGISINFTADIDGNANAVFTVSPIVLTQINASLVAAFRPLYFNASAQSYFELPSNQYSISTASGISITTSRSISLILAARDPSALLVNITGGVVAYANLVANTTVNFLYAEGNEIALSINNMAAASGTFSVQASSSSSNQAVFAVSSVYSFNHSAGSNAQVSATFRYDASLSTVALNATFYNNAAWYLYSNGAWVRQDSTVSGTIVTYTTNHFSDWSVRSSSTAGPSPSSQTSTTTTTTTGTTTGTATGNTSGSSSKMSSVLSTLLKYLF